MGNKLVSTPDGPKAIADALLVNASLTSLDVGYNSIDGHGAKQLAAAVLAKPTLEIFTSIPLKELRSNSLTTLDLSGKGLGIPGSIVLADLLQSVGASLTSVWTPAHKHSFLQATTHNSPACQMPPFDAFACYSLASAVGLEGQQHSRRGCTATG